MAMEDEDPVISSESESDSEEDEDLKLTEPSKTAVYNKSGLADKLEDLKWSENVDWIHRLSISYNQEGEIDIKNDLEMEAAFYKQALEGAREALTKFQSRGLPFLRPSDYYAEMVKDDAHMEKVKGRLLARKKSIEEADERRKARESKKLSKEVQAQKLKERAKQKKDEIESVKKWRKQRQQSGFAADDKDADFSLAFQDGKPFAKTNKKRPGVSPADRSGGKSRQGGAMGKKGKKNDREHRNSKFGFGGRKGLKKQNTAETTNDFRSFPSKKKQKK